MRIDAKSAGRIVELARSVGFDAAGIAAVPEPGSAEDYAELAGLEAWIEEGRAGEMEYLKRRDEAGRLLRSSARIAYPWSRSVLVCAVNYNSDTVHSTQETDPGNGWISRYAWSGGAGLATDYHTAILQRLRQLESKIQAMPAFEGSGFQSRCLVDTGPLVERVYAKYAGVGWLGKNTCVLNQELGSWLFLGVIVTSLEVAGETSPAALAEDRCGSCRRCIEACPTDALTAPYQMDASRCISYLTIEKRGAIDADQRGGIGRQVFGCDICQDVCPWNRRAPAGSWEEFQPRAELVNPSLEWLASLDRPAWKKLFRGSPVERAKFSGFMRNVAIAMGNSGEQRFREWLMQLAGGDDAGLRETAAWALVRLGETDASGELGKAKEQSQPVGGGEH